METTSTYSEDPKWLSLVLSIANLFEAGFAIETHNIK